LRPFYGHFSDLALAGSCQVRTESLQLSFHIQSHENLIREFADFQNLAFEGGAVPERLHGLWKDTCFEVFFSVAGSVKYWELNLSPQGNWNAYEFADYRFPQPPRECAQLRLEKVKTVVEPNSWRGDFDFTHSELGTKDFEFNLTAVVRRAIKKSLVKVSNENFEEIDVLDYYAINHATDRPDFHRRDCIRQDGQKNNHKKEEQ